MGLKGLKMQTNCLHVPPGDRPAEALAGPPEEEVVEGSPGDGLNQPPRLREGSRPTPPFVRRGQMADQQRRRQHPDRVVESFVRSPDGEGRPPIRRTIALRMRRLGRPLHTKRYPLPTAPGCG